jgi:hypothetical protein
MPKLHDYFSSDLNSFINQDEFAELHTINGVELPCVVDNDQLKERSRKEYDGITVGEVLFFIKKSDFGDRLENGTPIIFDKRQMYVFDTREDMGLYEIILSQNRGV